jgi:hypothetical protein
LFERKCGADLTLFFNGTVMSWCRTVFFNGCRNVLVPNCLVSVSGQVAHFSGQLAHFSGQLAHYSGQLAHCSWPLENLFFLCFVNVVFCYLVFVLSYSCAFLLSALLFFVYPILALLFRPFRFFVLYLYVVESLLGYETTGERAQLVAYGATTCS